jgi:hypothetical protein
MRVWGASIVPWLFWECGTVERAWELLANYWSLPYLMLLFRLLGCVLYNKLVGLRYGSVNFLTRK